MNKNNSLVEIPIEDWPKLRDLYVNRKLESNSFNSIENFINWLQQDPSLKESIKIFSLNGDWSDGTFLLQDHSAYIMMNTLQDSQERLLEALHCLDKKQLLILAGCPLRVKNTIETYLLNLGIQKESFQFSTTIWHHIDQERALAFDTQPPSGITLSSLRIEDIETVNNLWPHRHPHSELFVGRLVRLSQNIGAYDNQGNLVAWCLTLPMGALGLLQVQESHKRMGLGSLMVKSMSKMNAEKGIETLAPVVEENAASRAMFRKIGFQEIDKVYWFQKPALE